MNENEWSVKSLGMEYFSILGSGPWNITDLIS
jgi:hypothetical protein